jgi:YidC/Oxa1 family membrane protein insertase
MLSQLFNVVLYKPIFNIFVLLYNIIPTHDLGIVILIITILIRLAMYPLTSSSIKAQKSLQELQPKLNELKKKFGADKQGLAAATMELYKTHKVNPFKSCLPTLVQLPILIALYLVLQNGLSSHNLAESVYSFVYNPGTINPVSFGIFNLSKPNYILAILAGVAQFIQARSLSRKAAPAPAGAGGKDEDMMAMMNKQMLYVMPVMTVIIGFRIPAGLSLYWFLSTMLMWVQQIIISKKSSTTPPVAPVSQTSTPSTVVEGEIVK